MNRPSLARLGPLLLLPILAGCAGKGADPVLATVGEKKIDFTTYRAAWQGLPDKDKPDVATPEKRLDFLNDLVNKELLEMEARRRQPQLDDSQRRRLHRFAETALMNALTDAEINKKIAVSDAEVREVWNRMDHEYRCRHILVPTEDDARTALRRVKGGEKFEDVAKEMSKDPETGPKGGELGWVTAGQMVESFDHALFKLSPGDYSEPVVSRFGFHVIQCEERRDATRPDYDKVSERVRTLLLQQRSLARQEQFQKELKDSAKPENQLDAIQLIDRKFYFEVPPAQANDPYAGLNVNRTTPAFTEAELAMPVIKFADRPPLTIKDFNEELSWMPPGLWPTGGGFDEVEKLLNQITRTKLYRDHALKLGLERTPEYVRMLQKKESEMRVNGLYYVGIVGQINLSDQDKQNYFDAHRENYKVAERYRLSQIGTVDSSVAQLAARTWKSGKDFADVESMVKGLDPAVSTDPASYEIPKGQIPALDQFVFSGGVGAIVGPIWLEAMTSQTGETTPAHWVVAKVLDIRPERLMTYEEAEPYVADHAKTERSEAELKKVLEEARTRFTVKIDEAALAKITPEMMQEGLEKKVDGAKKA